MLQLFEKSLLHPVHRCSSHHPHTHHRCDRSDQLFSSWRWFGWWRRQLGCLHVILGGSRIRIYGQEIDCQGWGWLEVAVVLHLSDHACHFPIRKTWLRGESADWLLLFIRGHQRIYVCFHVIREQIEWYWLGDWGKTLLKPIKRYNPCAEQIKRSQVKFGLRRRSYDGIKYDDGRNHWHGVVHRQKYKSSWCKIRTFVSRN